MIKPTQVESLLDEALSKPPPERAVFLDDACEGNRELRQEVETRLLAAHPHAEGFLDRPAAQDTAAYGPLAEISGTMIGPYRLIEQIGEGGMGTVWMAQQTEPVKRLVALKLIKAGMDSRQVIARFEAERQALALMDHANIARVLDAGTTNAGRPFFVMDLVKGVPITRYCDEHHLTPRQRLELFLPVCQAVQHAHQKGIIHRDLKPSNVLVALYDGKPVPKVIDFGVAKAAGQPLTEKTLVTGFGNIVGTLEYMSPEQAEINQLDIDTRSDIYSLGVILYELLAGSPPFTNADLGKAGMLEMLRVIREKEPSKPSTKLSTADGLPTLAANRGTEPAKLTRLVRGELDWIVMKALEKDRSLRYETANGFAMDVQRDYLADEPVLACPPSAVYRIRKFVRRHRGPVLAATLVLLALLAGILGTTIGLVRAERARKDAVAAREGEADQRRVAEDERAIAQAVNDYLEQDLLRQADSQEQADRGFDANPNLTVKEALNRAAEKIGDRFQERPLVEAAIRQAIGETYHGLAEYERALPHLKRAVELRTIHLGPEHLQTIDSKDRVASLYLYLERPAEALAPFEEVVRVRRKKKLGPSHRDTLDALIGLSFCYKRGRMPEAIAILEEVLRVARAELPPNDPLTRKTMSNLAIDYTIAGRQAEAIAIQEEVRKAVLEKRGPRHPSSLLATGILAMCYIDAKRYAEAAALHEETLRLMKEVYGPGHEHTLTTMYGLTRAYRGMGRLADAAALTAEALKLRETKPGINESHLFRDRMTLAELYLDLGKYDEAEPLARQCLAFLEKDYPDDIETFECKILVGGALEGRKKHADAESLLLAGYEGFKKHQDPHSMADRDFYLGHALKWLVQLYEATGKVDLAAKWRKEQEARPKAADAERPKPK